MGIPFHEKNLVRRNRLDPGARPVRLVLGPVRVRREDGFDAERRRARGSRSETDTAARPSEARELFAEYASLWASLMSTSEDEVESRARVAEIDEMDPEMTEAYARSLLYVYQHPALSCATSSSQSPS